MSEVLAVEVQESVELNVVEKSKADQIRDTFVPMANKLSDFEKSYNEIIEKSKEGINRPLIARAKRLRLDIRKVRTETEKIRKQQKEEYLRAGKAIDGVSNIIKWAVSDKEAELEKIEKYFEVQEAERLKLLQEKRVEALSPYVEDAEERKLSDMDDDVWEAYLAAKVKDHEDKIAAEKEAEKERQRLKKIQNLHDSRRELALPYYSYWSDDEKQSNLGELSDEDFQSFLNRICGEKQKKDLAEQKKREEQERLLEESRKKEAAEKKKREELEAKLAKERKEKEELEKAEAARKAEEEAKIQAELNKGDADKVKDLVADLEALKSKYSFKSKKNNKMYSDVGILLDKVIGHIKK